MGFAAIPFMKNSFADVSDTYIMNQMNHIQSEMLFIDAKRGVFTNACTQGVVGVIVQDVIQNTDSVRCKTNPPSNSQMIVCAGIKNNHFYCVDYLGISCELSSEPKDGFRCKDV